MNSQVLATRELKIYDFGALVLSVFFLSGEQHPSSEVLHFDLSFLTVLSMLFTFFSTFLFLSSPCTEAIKSSFSFEEIDSEITATYNGKTYALCCKSCLKKFNKDPEKYVSKLSEDGKSLKKNK